MIRELLAAMLAFLAIGFLVVWLFLQPMYEQIRKSIRRHLRWRPVSQTGHFCRQCGYDLTGNRSGICPECGKATA